VTLALSGITVIDASQGVSGPLCAMVLADLGADVIKVEPPDGDWLREVGPFENGESALFVRLNRGKKGVCLDLKDAPGKEAFETLVKTADVLVEGYRTGVMERLGLGYEALSGSNPGLIYCSISGYGSKGPMAEMPATELDIQATIGMWRRLGNRFDAPLRVGFDMVSSVAGWAAVQAILAGLFVRERTGEGQRVETSLMHAAVALQSQNLVAESNPDRWKKDSLAGYTRPPEHGYRCKDAFFLLDISRSEEWWQVFCQAIAAEELLDDTRFANFDMRQDNRPELIHALAPYLAEWSFDDLREVVRGLGGTMVRIHDAATLFQDPQVAALGLVRELEHPVAGAYQTLSIPWDFSEPIAELAEAPAPTLGQHTRQVLSELGFRESDIAAATA
jgi:crotonobetainyl-CoA:carnitine CoA-transferase CaiB-like acyl-CoA transferase